MIWLVFHALIEMPYLQKRTDYEAAQRGAEEIRVGALRNVTFLLLTSIGGSLAATRPTPIKRSLYFLPGIQFSFNCRATKVSSTCILIGYSDRSTAATAKKGANDVKFAR